MKELTKYNRVGGYLNKLYDMANAEFFGGELERPVITIQSTPKAYGHFTLYDAWTVNGNGIREINIGAGSLARPIENVIATLLHEMCHQYNALHGIKDVSRGGTYHNKCFRQCGEAHGLTILRSEQYGWTITEPSEKLIDWILENDLVDIPMCRNEEYSVFIGGIGGNSGSGGRPDGNDSEDPPTRKTSYRKHTCPACGLIARTTKDAKLICGDCEVEMVRA